MSVCLCGRRFVSSAALQQHQRAKHHCTGSSQNVRRNMSSPQSFTCSGCTEAFSHLEALKQHQRFNEHCFCRDCNMFFIDLSTAEQHRSSVHSFNCSDCKRIFVNPDTLQKHQRSTEHCYCCICDVFLVDANTVKQHRSKLHAFACVQCSRVFDHQHELQQHQVFTKHCYCHDCDQFFVSSRELRHHIISKKHPTEFHCCDCDRSFRDEQALRQHLSDKKHKKHQPSPKSAKNLTRSEKVCQKCGQEFKTAQALQQHEHSLVHKPLSNLRCGGGGKCDKQFSSPSAWLHHLESGACASHMTRHELNTAIQQSDVDHLITKKGIEEGLHVAEDDLSGITSSSGGAMLTPVTEDGLSCPSSSAILGARSGMLTPSSEHFKHHSDASALPFRPLCPLCPHGRKPFKNLEALMMHLSSPLHSPKIFHCPSFLKQPKEMAKLSEKTKHFSTLSGLMQHLESGVCPGGSNTFRKTVDYLRRNWQTGLRKLQLLD